MELKEPEYKIIHHVDCYGTSTTVIERYDGDFRVFDDEELFNTWLEMRGLSRDELPEESYLLAFQDMPEYFGYFVFLKNTRTNQIKVKCLYPAYDSKNVRENFISGIHGDDLRCVIYAMKSSPEQIAMDMLGITDSECITDADEIVIHDFIKDYAEAQKMINSILDERHKSILISKVNDIASEF